VSGNDLVNLNSLELVNTILTGMVTTITGTPTVAQTTSGTYRINNIVYTLGSNTNTTIPAQDASQWRYTILYINTSGTITAANGSLSNDPIPPLPSIPANTLDIAEILIPPIGNPITVGGGGKKGSGTTANPLQLAYGFTGAPISFNGLATVVAKIDTSKLQTVLNFFPKGDTRYQKILVSGTNIKTINGISLLGSGNLSVITSPAGSDKQIQYDSLGHFSANPNFVFDYTHNRLNIGQPNSALVGGSASIVGELRLLSDSSSGATRYTILPQSGSLRYATNTTEIMTMGARGGISVNPYGFPPDSAYLQALADTSASTRIFSVKAYNVSGSETIKIFSIRGNGNIYWHEPNTGTPGDSIMVHHSNGKLGLVPSSYYATSTGSLTSSNFVTAEVPSGSINSSNTSFTLANTPVTGTVKVYRNGLRQIVGTDYTISGTTITYLYAPTTGDSIVTDYQK
jgi:hypothetical protein